MPTELLGVIGIGLWVMVMAAQLRRRRRASAPRALLRRSRLREDHR